MSKPHYEPTMTTALAAIIAATRERNAPTEPAVARLPVANPVMPVAPAPAVKPRPGPAAVVKPMKKCDLPSCKKMTKNTFYCCCKCSNDDRVRLKRNLLQW